MIHTFLFHRLPQLATVLAQPTIDLSGMGKWVFVGALGLLLIWLIVMPRKLIGQARQVPPWWRNVRFWAIVVCLLQLWIYWRFA